MRSLCANKDFAERFKVQPVCIRQRHPPKSLTEISVIKTVNKTHVLRTADEIRSRIISVRQNHVQSVKEVVRHGLLKIGLIGGLDRRRKRKGYAKVEYGGSNATDMFERTYAQGGWVHASNQESRSGLGSESWATEGLLDRISESMELLGCRSLVDVGCGDWNWMKLQAIHFDYTGVDIVPNVIAENQQYARENVRFLVCNAITDIPPNADLALCREVLFHLSFANAKSVVKNTCRSARHLCATTDLDIWFNSDIRTGDYRQLNLLRAPFSFPYPKCLIPDGALSASRFLGIWDTESLLQRIQ